MVVANSRRKFLEFLKNPDFLILHKVFLLFLLLAFFSNFSALHPISAGYKFVKLILFYVFAFLVGFLIARQDDSDHQQNLSLKKVFLFLNLGLILQSLIALGEWVTQSSLGLQILGEWRFSVLTPGIAKVMIGTQEFLRPYATFPHPNVLGGVMGIAAVVNLQRRLNLFCFFLFSFILLLTFSRSAWFAYLVLLILTLFFWLRAEEKTFWQKLKVPKFPIFLSVILLIVLTPLIWERFQSLQTIDQLSVERRVQLNLAAWEMIKKHPILGVGLNQFIPNLEKYVLISGPGRFLQPVHNVYLLILAEHGLLGFLVFSFFLLIIIKRIIYKPSISNLQSQLSTLDPPFSIFIPLIMLLGIFIISFFDHYFWTLQAGQLFFWLTIGLILTPHKNFDM